MQPRETVAIRNLSAKFVSQISAAVFFLAVALLPSLRVSIAATPTPQEDVLSQPAAIGDRSLPASSAFEGALQISGVSGGVAFVEGCADEPKPLVHPHGATLRQVLDSITSADSQYVWRMRKGLVNLEPVKGPPVLLQTHLKRYDSGDLTDAVSAVSLLKSLPELARAAAKHGLTQNVLGSGLGGMAPGPPSPKKPVGVRLHDVTLLDALNAIARANEHGVWTYRETHCGSVHQFNISFAQ
jgi:hypothetical protein